MLLSSLFQAQGMLVASSLLHGFMLARTCRAPVSFFDKTPTGRIVNRFGKDVDTLDNTLPQIVRSWFMCFFGVTKINNSFFIRALFIENLDSCLILENFFDSVVVFHLAGMFLSLANGKLDISATIC